MNTFPTPAESPFRHIRIRFLFLGFVLSVIPAFAVALLVRPPEGSRFVTILYTFQGVWIAWAAAFTARASQKHGLSWRRLLGPAPSRKTGLAWALLGLMAAACVSLWDGFFTWFGYIDEPLVAPPMAWSVSGIVPVAAILLLASSIGPAFEEISFRGLILHRLSYKWGTRRGIVVSAVLFCALHPPLFLHAFIMGLFLARLYLRTGSLWPPIVFHGGYNLILFSLEMLEDYKIHLALFFREHFAAAALALFVSSVFFIVAFRRLKPRDEPLPYERNAALEPSASATGTHFAS